MNSVGVLVIGSGVMGRGIAKSFATAGISSAIYSRNVARVTGIDPRVALLDKLPQEAPALVIESVPEEKDISGLDTHALAQRALVPVLHHGDRPRRALQDLYEAGHLGIRTGKGFYDWSGKDPGEVKAEAGRKLSELLAYLKQQR